MGATDVMMEAFEASTEEYVTNVITPDSNGNLCYSQTYAVKVPKASQKVALDTHAVKKVQSLCAKAKKSRFPIAEVFLGIASLFLGAFLSALIAKVPYEMSFASILSYNICPVGGAGFGVAYFFYRQNDSADVVRLATQIEECICESIDEGNEV